MNGKNEVQNYGEKKVFFAGNPSVGKRNLIVRLLARKGLPIFETIMIFVICSVAYVACVGGIFQSGERNKLDLNHHRMLVLNMCLQAYHWGNSAWPPDLDTLACEGRDRKTCIPHANPVILKDPWGTPYLYKFSADGFTLTSLGADQREGGRGRDADMIEEGP
ncbi:MAG: type II secretion system protein GspG [Elusimicrobia bacterium]|nr:type II secretion system protein GspG [Elusimicrobiota bacterium]